MRSRIAVCILSLSVAIFSIILGGCSNNENYPENSGESVGTELLSSNLSAVSNISTENPAQSSPTLIAPASSDQSSVPKVDNWDDFIGADGQPVTLDGAIVDEDGRVTLDYCFVKILPHIYDDTFKNPDLINWNTMEFAPFDGDYTPEIKRLRAGDVLPNGLKVKEAYRTLAYEEVMDEMTCEISREWCDSFGWVAFDGELTLNGALYCVPEDDYQVFGGELYFFPDTTSGAQLPAQCGITQSEYCVWENVYPEASFAVRSGTIYYVGNIDDVELDVILERGEAVDVTVTLGNIRIQSADINHGGRGSCCFAEIVSIEKNNS